MAETADVIVVGGGVVGLSVAYQLAERGVRDVLVLERATCGAGATLKATGGFRTQFGTVLNVQLSLLARPFWLSFAERFGGPPVFDPIGYLFLATTLDLLGACERQVAMQQALGTPVRMVTVDEAVRLAPGLNPEAVLGGSYCPWDGRLEVEPIMDGLQRGCRAAGVAIREHTAVTAVHTDGGRVQGVVTSGGEVAAPVVVNAAGVEAAAVAAMVGLEAPVVGQRRQAAVTAPVGLPPQMAWTIDLGTGCYARPTLDGRAIIGGGDRAPETGLAPEAVDAAGIERLRALVGARLPALAGVALEHAWVGLRPMSPDEHPLLGATPVAGFIQACGFSGHGLMQAPAAGLLVAELVVDGAARSLDIAPLAPDRFERGATLAGTVLL